MLAVTTNLIVSDMAKTLAFYCGKLGFAIEFGVDWHKNTHFDGKARPEYVFVTVMKGEWKIMLQLKESFAADLPAYDASKPLGGSFALYFRDADVDAIHALFDQSGHIIKEPETTWYGMREIYVTDPDGYILCFGAIDPAATPPA